MGQMHYIAERGPERFEIVEGGGEGFYVYRYQDGLCTHDYLQDDIAMAYECAEDEFGLNRSAWRAALPGEIPLMEKGR
jgi:hypothetical protein